MVTMRHMGGAFVVGGCIGLITQLLFVIAQMMVGTNVMLAMVVAFLMLGVLTTVLFVAGIYERIERVGYFGAVLPFSGLVAGVAHLYLGAKAEGGVANGIKAGLGLLIGVLGLGTIICIIIGAVYAFVF